MAIFDRLSMLLRANVHAAIDKAEDPEKMLDQLIRDAEAGRRAGQEQLVAIIAERNRIAAEATHEEKLARKALTQAETAVRRGNDDMAREALRRRHDAVEAANLYAQQAEAQQLIVERLKMQLSQMDSKLRRMRQERDGLVARKRMADAQLAMSNAARQVSGLDLDSEYARLSRSVRRSEAVAAASLEMYVDTLEGRLDALEDEQIETQLLSLKEQTKPVGAISGDPLLLALRAEAEHELDNGSQP
jgi:phage shock protein A